MIPKFRLLIFTSDKSNVTSLEKSGVPIEICGVYSTNPDTENFLDLSEIIEYVEKYKPNLVIFGRDHRTIGKLGCDTLNLDNCWSGRYIYYNGEFIDEYDDLSQENEVLIKNVKKILGYQKGKVCDIYDLKNMILLQYTDRLSAFDGYVCDVPRKGENVATMSRWWLERTKHIIPNHLICQDQNLVLVKKCNPILLEIVVRGYITGNTPTSLWMHYSTGERVYCGIKFPDGLKKNQKLDHPVVTPTTKSNIHDELISEEEIIKSGILTEQDYNFLKTKALELYEYGVETAKRGGLILVDTKYEFGRLPNGEIILIDEVHTCDSSRYWEAATYEERFQNGEEPDRIDKDIMRTHLRSSNNDNLEDIVAKISIAYDKFCERMCFFEANPLKYGCNPHQRAGILGHSPYEVLNGQPGYVNFLDAINSWALVSEVRKSLNTICVASFKHVSPAGVAILREINKQIKTFYGIPDIKSKVAITFLRARDIDPKSSFGDFVAISHKVDVETAELVKGCVSDGIIAPSYEEEAFNILRQKKGGKYIILKSNPFQQSVEYRTIGGCTLYQERNDHITSIEDFSNIVTKKKDLPENVKEDLVLANITAKYTQSNSIVYALNGSTIGIGAGQQSRIDCVKIAGDKARIWYARQDPLLMQIQFKNGTKRQEKINGVIKLIEDGYIPNKETSEIMTNIYDLVYKFLTPKDTKLSGVSLSSDAFFPFSDNIETANKHGVKYIVQPGGSTRDKEVIEECDKYGMVMVFTGVRLFHH